MTLLREPHELHVTKYNLFSPLLSSVSGERQVLQDTYSPGEVLVGRERGGEMWVNGDMAILTNITSEHVFYLLLLETTFDDETT